MGMWRGPRSQARRCWWPAALALALAAALVLLPACEPTQSIAAKAGRSEILFGTATKVVGRTRAHTSQVTLQRLVGRSWSDRGSATPTSDGSFTIRARPTSAGIYSLRVRDRSGANVSPIFYLRVWTAGYRLSPITGRPLGPVAGTPFLNDGWLVSYDTVAGGTDDNDTFGLMFRSGRPGFRAEFVDLADVRVLPAGPTRAVLRLTLDHVVSPPCNTTDAQPMPFTTSPTGGSRSEFTSITCFTATKTDTVVWDIGLKREHPYRVHGYGNCTTTCKELIIDLAPD